MKQNHSKVPQRIGDLSRVAALLLAACLTVAFFASSASAQIEERQSGTTTCTLDNGKQVSARYIPVEATSNLPQDKVWAPGGAAITLFTESSLAIGNQSLAVGAYTMYLVPGKKDWTLIVSKNVDVDRQYDRQHDLARASMTIAKLKHKAPELRVTFGHIAPTKCELNVDFGSTKAWVEFSAL